ncbi:MAG TPA: hypothetical protein VL346_12595 [Acidobacteriaceae bacterium]|jgi:hypothetical protein|nr:hypothetical protein [Acidobacteriaceae bacterium]
MTTKSKGKNKNKSQRKKAGSLEPALVDLSIRFCENSLPCVEQIFGAGMMLIGWSLAEDEARLAS